MRSLGRNANTNPRRLVVVGLVAVAVAAIVAVQAIQQPTATPTRPADAAITPPVQPLIASVAYVRSSGADGRVLAGRPVTVSAHALGESGVAALELWDGTERLAAQGAGSAPPRPASYARWQWTPAEPGLHTLFVRAIDLRGGVVQSNVVRVQVAPSPAGSSTRAMWALAGSSTRLIGGALGIASRGRRLDLTATSATRYAIATPTLQATLEGCELQLKVAAMPAQATGVQLVGLAPAGSAFTPLVALAAEASATTQTIDLAAAGSFLFAASAFDASVVAYSQPVEVLAPARCEGGGWSGGLSLVAGKLLGGQAVDKAYLYLTQGSGAAVRVPAGQSEFVETDGSGALDFGPVLPALDGSPLAIEAWGWKGDQLVNLGSGSFTPAPTPSSGANGASSGGATMTFGGGLEKVAGTLTTLRVINRVLSNDASAPAGVDCVGPSEFCYYEEAASSGTIERPADGTTKPLLKRFRWTTVLANVNQFVWQILPYPPPKSADLTPPFVVDQGVVVVTPGEPEGEFSIDFNKYFLHTTPTLSLGLSTTQSSGGQLQLFGNLGGSSSSTATPAPSKSSTIGQFAYASLDALQLAAFGDKFYVRLVPIEFNSASPPSNAVTLDVVEPAVAIEVIDPHAGEGWNQNAYTVQWTFEPPVGPDPAYARCALVTSVDFGVVGPTAALYEAYRQSGKPLCYEPPSDDGWSVWDAFDAFVEFVSDVWDYVADAADWVKQQVVAGVLTAVPCKEIASEEVCKGIANTALNAALISVGVPPTLPDFDTVVAGLKGDLETFIVQSAQSIPGVAEACGLAEAGNAVSSKVETCEELAGVAIDEIISQVKQARSDAAGQASGWAAPGVTFEPDPRGIWHPPAFNLTITRTSDPVLPKTCSLWTSMKSTKKGWTFPELWNGYPKNVTSDVSGVPLTGAGMIIPPMAPGKSITRKLWLSQPTIWFESQRSEWYWKYYQALNTDLAQFSRAWVLLTGGSELTFGVGSNCAKASEQGPVVLAKSAYDSN